CFDRVTAGFVISHVPSYEMALADMVRVLRPGGKLGVTAWGDLGNEFRDLWDSLVESAAGADAVRAANAKSLPWEDWFAHPENVKLALAGAGLEQVAVDVATYPIHM